MLLKVPRLLPKLVRLPLPAALRLPALVNTAPPPTWMALLPLHTALVLLLVKLRALRMRFCELVFRVSGAPLDTTVAPEPVMLPPDQMLLPPKVSVPIPVSVPPLSVNGPLMDEDPARSRLPALIVRPSAEISRPATAVPLTVTTGLPSGPRSMMTVSPAVGNTPPLQLLAVVQAPLESVFQILTPVKVVPRCNTMLLASPPAT